MRRSVAGVDRDVAIVVLYDAQRRILLQHRDARAPIYPECWSFFGGGIESGETPLQAVIRETWEEIHYTLRAPVLFMETAYADAACGHRGRRYCYHEACTDKSGLRLGEGQAMGWSGFSEIERLITPPAIAPILARLRQALITQTR